jgi:hypothetical protein
MQKRCDISFLFARLGRIVVTLHAQNERSLLMASRSLRQIREFHAALLLLVKAGVHVQLLAGTDSEQALQDQLEKIEIRAIRLDESMTTGSSSTTEAETRRTADGDEQGLNSQVIGALDIEFSSESGPLITGHGGDPTVTQRLLAEADIPPNYRSALACWCSSGGAPQSLSLLTESWRAGHQLLFVRRMRWLTPLIWAAVASIVLGILSTMVFPQLSALARDVGYRDGFVEFATRFQAWLPLGCITLVGGVCFAYFLSRRVSGLRLSRLSQKSNVQESYSSKVQTAVRVDQWSRLCEQSVEASRAWDQVTAADLLAGDQPSRPALIDWALAEAQSKSTSPNTIDSRRHFVAEAYRSIQTVYRFGLRNPTPGFMVTLFGGILAAALGASIFYPVVQILVFVTNSVGAEQ